MHWGSVVLFIAFICVTWKSEIDALKFLKTNQELFRPVVVGEIVLIDCSTEIKSVTLTLLKRDNGSSTERLLKPDNQQLKQDGQNFTLLISGETDSGVYTCQASGDDTTIQKTLTVYIAAKVSGAIPEPIVNEPLFEIKEGRTLKITCSTKGTFAKLSWNKEGVKVDDTQVTHRPLYYYGGMVMVESILTIDDVKLQDNGLYNCVSVSRFDPTKKATATTRVNVQDEKLYWINNNPNTFNSLTGQRNSAIIISCALSHPAKKIKFFRAMAGSPLAEIKVNSRKYQLINGQELVIQRLSLLDYGMYVCRVENNLLEDKKIQLYVDDSGATKLSVSLDWQTMVLDFNENANVTCTTYGDTVDVEWLRSVTVDLRKTLQRVAIDKVVKNDAKRTPQGKIERSKTLVLKNVTVDESGSYICKVTMGKETAFKQVDVRVKKPLSPEIRKFDNEVTEENKRVSLNCRNRGVPNPKIEFFKDGTPIVSSNNGYVINGRKLTINAPKFPNHNGTYTCSVSNMFGKATKTSILMVTVAPTIKKSKKIVVVASADDLVITCDVKRSNPIPKITWEYQPWPCPAKVKNNCVATKSGWQSADTTDVKPSMTSVFNVPTFEGERVFIRCKATHKYGSDSHEVLGIIDPRDATKSLKSLPENVDIDEREKIKLTCTGEAGLFVKLTWKKDGKVIVPQSNLKVTNTGSILEKRRSVLTVYKATAEDSGFYECIGAPIRSVDDSVVSGSEVTINKIYVPKVKSFKNLNVSNGDNAVIKCKVDSHPLAKVTWYKDGEVLTNINRIDNETDCKNRDEGTYFEMNSAKEYILIVCKSVWKINSGTYSCQARNILGVVQKKSSVYIYASPEMAYDQTDEYVKLGEDFSRNCTSEGNPSPYMWWEHQQNGEFSIVTKNTTSGISYLNITKVEESRYGNYRCVAYNEHGRIYSSMTLKQPLVAYDEYKTDDNTLASTASLIAALIAAIFIIIILILVTVVLCKRKRLYGGFYIFSIPPSPDFFKKIDPTRPLSEQTSKLPYFPEWEYPRNKLKLKNCVGSGAFGEVYIADAVGMISFDPRYKISTKHKALLGKKRWSFSRTKTFSRQDSLASTKSTKGLLNGKDVSTVAVKKLKDDATNLEYKDLISELKILIHIGQNENIVNLLAACTKGIEKECMVVLEYCPHGNLLSFIKDRRQMFKPIWSKQHIGIENELTTFDLCVAGYQIAKGLEYLASRKCVHRDVAARNVLVGENYVMKIADFGLARDVYQDENYVKVSGGLLPLKWMAIESIFDRVYTHASDVWSFGILMWEVMTLGGSPYPGLPAKELPEYLSSGNRMNQPGLCPNEVYTLISETWNELPSHRPSFSDIVVQLARIVEAHCNQDDILMYLDKCHVAGGTLLSEESDYLKPVDSDIGSYKFQPPPSYSEKANTPANNSPGRMQRLSTRSSERYVPDNRFRDDDGSSTNLSDKQVLDKTMDSCDGSIEPKAKMDEIVSEKDMITSDRYFLQDDTVNNNESSYENEARLNRKNKESMKMSLPDEDKDIDEQGALLDAYQSDQEYINT